MKVLRTDKGHFWLTFENGYTISVFNGFGSYSENHFRKEYEFASVDSNDCEIAILYNNMFVTSRFVECNDSVKGYVSVEELAEIICKVKNYKDGKVNNQKLKKQQKEFIKYLEKRYKDVTSVIGSFGSNTDLLYGKKDMIEEISQKYKEIIGGNKQ